MLSSLERYCDPKLPLERVGPVKPSNGSLSAKPSPDQGRWPPGTSRHLPAACTSGAGEAAEPYAELVMLRDATGDDASNADAVLAARSRDVSTTSLNRLGSDRARATNVGQGTYL
jgi:hypothetical protein